MDMSQLEFVIARHGGDAGLPGSTRRVTRSRTRGRAFARRRLRRRQALLGLASTQLGVPVATLTVSKGVVSGGGKSVTYGQLARREALQRHDAGELEHGPGEPGDSERRRLQRTASSRVRRRRSRSASTSSSARASPRIDIPEIVTGKAVYIQNVRRAGHAARARRAAARADAVRVRRTDRLGRRELDRAPPDVKIVRKGDFLGVVAPHEYDAIQAAAQLKVKWADPAGGAAGQLATSSRACARSTPPARRVAERFRDAHGRRRRRAGVGGPCRQRDLRLADATSTPRSGRCARSPT